MYIQTLELKNYRNYNFASINFEPGINIIYGDNAQGKTNIIEAIYMCATSKSHRTSIDKELIKIDELESHVYLRVEKDNILEEIDVHLKRNSNKGIAINKVAIRKMNELLGVVHVVLFSPEDLGLIKNGPKERRRFIDMELSQLDKLYFYNLSQYHKVLKQRNNLLKKIQNQRDLEEQLDIWDLQLVQYGEVVIELREQFIDELKPIVYEKHHHLTGYQEELVIIYEKDVERQDLKAKLEKNRQRDIYQGSTSVGPHRDDICFKINDIDVRTYGSQGQQRTAALSLKLSEIELVKLKSSETPILLLDDVLSELDKHRQQYLIEHLQSIQTIITCTGIEDLIQQMLVKKQLFFVKNANIIKKSNQINS